MVVLVTPSALVPLVAFFAGAVIGTAVGIVSALWARSDRRKIREREIAAAMRLVNDELRRLAAFVERCLAGDLAPTSCAEAARASAVAPPLPAWQECGTLLAGCLDDDTWQLVTRAADEWPVLFDAMRRAPDQSAWRGPLHAGIATYHRHVRAAADAVADEQ